MNRLFAYLAVSPAPMYMVSGGNAAAFLIYAVQGDFAALVNLVVAVITYNMAENRLRRCLSAIAELGFLAGAIEEAEE